MDSDNPRLRKGPLRSSQCRYSAHPARADLPKTRLSRTPIGLQSERRPIPTVVVAGAKNGHEIVVCVRVSDRVVGKRRKTDGGKEKEKSESGFCE